MEDVTIISYPGVKKHNLLSLVDNRSKYMLPFGGRFRVVDFTIRNSFFSNARRTIIFNDYDDDLENYVESYGPFKEENFPRIKVVSKQSSDINTLYTLIIDSNTGYYILYNGDNPSIIDFKQMMENYFRIGSDAVLFKLKFADSASLANTVLVSNQKLLLDVVNTAIEEKRNSPNFFEMIINLQLHTGIATEEFEVYYWPLRNIPDFYAINMEILRNPEFFNLLFRELKLESQILVEGYARVGMHAKIRSSFVSDGCDVHGTIINSIIYPGVYIGEKSIVQDSIVLPFARIGDGTRITRTIVDERMNFQQEYEYPNIGNHCIVGSDYEQLKNNDFPRSIFSSITLIGKDCKIPDGSRIGGACYVASGKGEEYFMRGKHLYDGLSIVN